MSAGSSQVHNRVLAGLSPSSRRRLQLVPVALDHGKLLCEQNALMRHVYFPSGSLVSLLTIVDSAGGLEVGLVGREGMVGLPIGLGFPRSPVRVLVQGAGMALRTTAERFCTELRRDAKLQSEVARCAHVSMSTAMRVSGCNNTHNLTQRLARWLLMMRDRVASDELPITQTFLAPMLGVLREGVSRAAGDLQRRRLISYSRGTIRIVNLKGLRAAACSCYEAIRRLEAGSTTGNR